MSWRNGKAASYEYLFPYNSPILMIPVRHTSKQSQYSEHKEVCIDFYTLMEGYGGCVIEYCNLRLSWGDIQMFRHITSDEI